MTHRILAVEDSATQAFALQRLLDSAGYDVTMAKYGEDALGILADGSDAFDLVISDVVMPGAVDGYELCRRIKEGAHRATPVILLTSLSDPLEIVKGLESGADNFLTKPYDGPQLLERIAWMLDTRTARRAQRQESGVQVHFLGRDFTIHAEREQILDLLISTFEDAVRQNRDLRQRETELEAARAELAHYARVLESDLNRFFDLSPDMIATVGYDGYLKQMNPAWSKWLGWSDEELLSREMMDLVHPDDRIASRAAQTKALGGSPVMQFENRIRCRDGSYRWLEWRAIPAPQEELLFAIARDVTERKAADRALQQGQRLESVGRLAGGIAHDFNNLLTVILSYSEILMGSLPEGVAGREEVGEIVSATERATRLTRQLLAFSKRQILEPRVIRLNDTVSEIEQMLRRLIGADITLQVTLDAQLHPVLADPGQVEQVIVNLVVNARDAMPKGGQLTVTTFNTVVDAAQAERGGFSPGAYAVLCVRDSGHGIDADTLARIFEPFFTTKGPDRGTGLGLATVYGIVKQSRGHIAVSSELGVGTTFSVYWPRTEGTVASPASRSAPSQRERVPTPRSTDGAVVLLVEDDTQVRDVTARVLRRLGYTVLEAAEGHAALALAAHHAGRIDLLVCDLVMPHMSGMEVAEALRQARPGLRVLHLSGHSGTSAVAQELLASGAAYLQKPFTIDGLARKVRELLAKDDASR